VLNVIWPVPVGGGIETVGDTYVMDTVDTVASFAESVALTSIVCVPSDNVPVVNDQLTAGPGVIPDTVETWPLSTFHDIFDIDTMSVAFPDTVIVDALAIALFLGVCIDIVGGTLLITYTGNVPVAAFPCASVAVHVTVSFPNGNVEPDGGLQTGLTGPSTRSVAFARYVTGAPDGPVACTIN